MVGDKIEIRSYQRVTSSLEKPAQIMVGIVSRYRVEVLSRDGKASTMRLLQICSSRLLVRKMTRLVIDHGLKEATTWTVPCCLATSPLKTIRANTATAFSLRRETVCSKKLSVTLQMNLFACVAGPMASLAQALGDISRPQESLRLVQDCFKGANSASLDCGTRAGWMTLLGPGGGV
jgi:hypothetical protein